MNKKELDEVLKIMNEPITVNSIDYKYFTQEQYDRLIRVYDNARWLVDYALSQSRYIDNLSDRIDKAEECIKNFLCTEEYINIDGIAIANNYAEVLQILKGKE